MCFTPNWFSSLMYRTYLNRILPRLAKRFSLNPAAYGYLADSIMNFPSPDAFLGLMKDSGLIDLKKHKLTFGATFLYTGMKQRKSRA
jgi:demethylmenaquinone methyltransferase / 2-methoxy-6-polyprenyl-1,4-benzoquinol methylase